MWGLKKILILLSPLLVVVSGQMAGLEDCPLYKLSVTEGSSGFIPINMPKNSSFLCQMPATSAAATSFACNHIMILNKGILNYQNSTFRGRLSLSDGLVTVTNASKWMATEYRVISALHEICIARINLTVPESRDRYCLWASLTSSLLLYLLLLYFVCWKDGREGPKTCHHYEEKGTSDSADSPV